MDNVAPSVLPAAPIMPQGWITYQNSASRVILKPDAIDDAGIELDAIGCKRLMVLCGGSTARSPLLPKVLRALGDRTVVVFDRVVEHSSTILVTQVAEAARSARIDGLVAVGGGSVSDTAKGIAILLAEGGDIESHASRFVPPDEFYPNLLHKPKLPILAIPTTASAAEVTPGLGIRNPRGEKKLFWDVKLACRVILLDPTANLSVPVSIMAATAMNGFAHCAEGLYSRLRNSISEALALQGIRMFTSAIPAMVSDPADPDQRGAVLAAAHLSGMVISNARVGIHHAICHNLGAIGGISHGAANAIMLPHALEYNLPVAAAELARMAEAMGVNTRNQTIVASAEAGIAAVRELQRAAKVPTRLRDVGLSRELFATIAQNTLGDRGLFFNPRPTETSKPIVDLLNSAW